MSKCVEDSLVVCLIAWKTVRKCMENCSEVYGKLLGEQLTEVLPDAIDENRLSIDCQYI